jgi:hypothetical protein
VQEQVLESADAAEACECKTAYQPATIPPGE